MNSDLENVLRTIEVAQTKLKLLSENASSNAYAAKADTLLSEAHTILTGSPGKSIDPIAVVRTPPTLENSTASELTHIKHIDATMASTLNEAGITGFDEIANWQADDVAKMTAALSLGTRINHENWIEEAAILAKGNKTAYLRSLPPVRPEVKEASDLKADDVATLTAATSQGTVTNDKDCQDWMSKVATLVNAGELVTPEDAATPSPIAEAPTESTESTESEAAIPVAPAIVTASAVVAVGIATTDTAKPVVADEPSAITPTEEPPIKGTSPAEPTPIAESEAPPVELATVDATPPNDQREATIEIKPRTDSQLAYPNANEDADDVVKRFMRALTGDSENDSK